MTLVGETSARNVWSVEDDEVVGTERDGCMPAMRGARGSSSRLACDEEATQVVNDLMEHLGVWMWGFRWMKKYVKQ